MELSQEQYAAFHREGYLSCGLLWSKQELELVQTNVVEALCLGKVSRPGLAMLKAGEPYPSPSTVPPGFAGASVTAYRQLGGVDYDSGLQSDTIVKAFAAKLAAVRSIFGLHCGVALAHAAVYLDSNATPLGLPAGGTLWQDGGAAFALDRDPVVTAYVPLSEPKGPLLKVATGSHVRGVVSADGGVLAPDAAERVKAAYPFAEVRAKAGEAVLVHGWTVRCVPPSSGCRVLVLHFVDSRARTVVASSPLRMSSTPGVAFAEIFPSAFARDASRHGLSRSRCGSSATGGGGAGAGDDGRVGSVSRGWFDRWSGRYSTCLSGEEAAAALAKAAEELATQLAATGISEDGEE